jgi:type VI secretion system protein ImpL
MVLRAQRDKLAQVRSLLVSMGAPDLAQRLGSQQAAEVGSRLARVHDQLKTLPLLAPAPVDFSWWRGEPAPLFRAFGVADAGALQIQLADQYQRLDAMGRQAEQYLSASDGSMAADPGVQRWQRIIKELERYRAQLPDSSMLAYERYVLTLGPYLRRENCLENLGAQRPPRHDDEIAQRLTQMHNGLVQRCVQLRNQHALGTTPN